MIQRDWKEAWVDQMGLIVALSGEARFAKLRDFKTRMAYLSHVQTAELKECLRLRFAPSNGENGCREATQSVQVIIL